MEFFHRRKNSHKRRNYINKMKIDGVWSVESNSLRQDTARAF